MNTEIRLQQPQVYGSRTIIPMIRDISFCTDYGIMVSVQPVALLIGERGKWGIVLLEGESVDQLLEKCILPESHG